MRPTKEDNEMKNLLIALAALTALSSVSAYAYNCTQTCYWMGNQQICNTYCY